MMKKITFLIAILTFSLGYAQTLPFDFSNSLHLMTGADGAVTSIVQDNGNDVLQVAGAGGAWDNAQIDFSENLDLSDDSNNTLTFRIKAVNGTGSGTHAVKFENGTTGNTELQFTISGTEWTEISLDFPANLGSYKTMVLFTDFGDGNSSVDTYLVDDIAGAFHSTPVLPNLPFDFSSSEQLMSGGDGAVTSLVVDGTNDVLQIVGAAAAWDHAKASFKNNVDLSDDDNNTITFKIKPINGTGTGNHLLKFEGGVAGPAVAELPFTTTGTEWQTITLDFGTGLGNYPTMVLFVDSGDAGAGVSDTFLVDDIAGGTLVTEEVVLPNLPFDFSSSNQLMPGGDGAVTSLVVDGTNDVLQIVGAAAAWDHAKASFKDNVDLSDDDNNTIIFKIKPINGTGTGNHLLKFEGGVAGPAVAELPFTTTGTEWQTITLDFGTGLGNYPTMVLFVDSGDAGAGVSDTFLVDDISKSATIVSGPDLIITGAFDGTLSGGTPKGIELFVVNDISDLSIYGVGSANNGGGSDGNEFTFPADAVVAGTFLYVATEASNFEAFFGMAPNYTSGSMAINGDDAVELFKDDAVIETFGDIDTDGNGEDWEYLDGWAYRNSGTESDGTFVIADWTFSGVNGLEGGTDNATATSPFPIGTYTVSATAGVKDNDMSNISMYPNPTSNRLNISAQSIIKSAVIYNILGKQVMRLDINKNSESIDVSSLASGMYLIKYSLGNAIGTAKFIKQ